MSVSYASTLRQEFDSLTSQKHSSIAALEEIARDTSDDLKSIQNKLSHQEQFLTDMSLVYIDQQAQEKVLQKMLELDTDIDLFNFHEGAYEQLTKETNELKTTSNKLDTQMNARVVDIKNLTHDVNNSYRLAEERKTQVNSSLKEVEQLEREFEQLINEDNDDKELFESALEAESFDVDPSQINSQAKLDVEDELKRITAEISKKEADINNERSNVASLKTQLEGLKLRLERSQTDDSENDPLQKNYYFCQELNKLLEFL
ncbi:hypothetical protein CANMA_000255 [Candida margitis]|uniref:uncharacterized protein n=1 Tax=Candida margitis TaxID=1775924 RepID=UPI002227DE7C|nr:uncharacterized protein CANMA_000255 [Candida margitis]KAI5970664.1 hypothetical protein CANMA_000255 [Candida margitis]